MRDSYADFLRCREDFQTAMGIGVAAVAAASGAVTVGASTVAGVALAGSGAAGLGLDFIAYNSAKSAAYATAISQLQCVIYDTSNLLGTLKPLEDKKKSLDLSCKAPSDSDALYFYNDLQAEKSIAQQQVQFLEQNYQRIGRDIFATTQNIDVRAFSSGQSGVPSAATLQSALQSPSTVANAIKSILPTAAGGTGQQLVSGIVRTVCSTDELNLAQESYTQIRRILKQIVLPQSGFPDCMALSGGGSAAATATAGPLGGASSLAAALGGNSTSTTPAGASPIGGAAPGGAQGATPAQKPTSIPFQVLPASAPGQSGGAATPPNLQTDLLPITINAKSSGTAVIKIVGGTAPYYNAVVDDCATIVQETETDPFVSYQVQLKSESPANCRVLFADQGGSQQFVRLKPSPAPPPTAATPKPSPSP
jgi:hypothetical protein